MLRTRKPELPEHRSHRMTPLTPHRAGRPARHTAPFSKSWEKCFPGFIRAINHHQLKERSAGWALPAVPCSP